MSTSGTGSGTMARVEGLGDALERLQTTLDRMDDRTRAFEVSVSIKLAELGASLANVKSLIDGVHARASELEERIEKLETAAAEERGRERERGRNRVLAAASTGGGVAAVVEVVRSILGAT